MARNSFYTGSVANAIAIDTSADEAAASATAAAASASTAATQASNSATSATSSAASYDSFDDRYLGAKSSAPSVDNDGDALIAGALYWNTASDQMFVREGSAWVAIKPTTAEQADIAAVENIKANVTTVAGISSDVTTVAGISSDVAAVENIAANVTSVAGIASNVTSVAGNASNINAAVANASNINAATTKANEAAASATASANSATASASSASTASTQGGIATAKAVLTAADAVSTAADVVSSASNAASAAATFDSFDDRYLGSKSSEPSVDNDGNSLIIGALYFDSTGGTMKVYTASGWLATSSASLATMNRFVFTATSNQTVFQGNDAGGDTLAIVVGAEIVTLNGVVLEVTADYTVTTSKITLASGAAANDELNVYAFGNFTIASHYSKTAADARFEPLDSAYTKAEADTLLNAKASLASPTFTGNIGMPNGSIDTAHIGDDQVTADKLANSINSEITANTAKTGITTSQTNAIIANTAKITNATHTGEVTGSGALTIANDAVTTAKLNLISTSSVPSIEARSDGTTDGYIQLNCTANTHGIKLKSPPHSAGASYTLTFPNDDGASGQKLTTDGSGVLTWTADNATDSTKLPLAGGTMTGNLVMGANLVDGVDISARDAVLTSTTTTAGAALPKAGGTMTGAVVGATDTDTSNSGTVDLDFTNNTNFVLTLTGNVTSLTASNEVVGQSGFIVFIQDGTGSRTVALHGDYETAGAAGLTLTSTASATDIVPYVVAASSRILLGAPQLAFA